MVYNMILVFFEYGGSTYLFGVFIEGGEPDEIRGSECIGKIAKIMYTEVQNG